MQICAEPSIMYYFDYDRKPFHFDTKFEKDEIPQTPIDVFCVD